MKILLLITKGEIGGAQNFLASLAQALKNKGLNPTIACGEGDFLSNLAQRDGIDFFRFKSLRRSGGLFLNFKFFFEFFKYLKNNNFDIVHLNSSNALIGAMIAKIASPKTRVIFTVHGLSVLDPNYEASYLKKMLYRLFFKWNFLFLDKIVFVSQKNLDFLTKGNKSMTKKSYLVYNGIQVDFLERERARNILLSKIGKKDDDVFLIGSLGRLAYPKNYDFLLNNFDRIKALKPNSILILIGEGPKRQKYERIIREKKLGNSVFLLGEIEGANRYLKGLDLFVLPSIYEGLSISLIEAYLAEINSIASLVGGNEEIIESQYCFKLNDLDDFMKVFKIVLNSNPSHENKDRFSLDTMIKNYLKLYEE